MRNISLLILAIAPFIFIVTGYQWQLINHNPQLIQFFGYISSSLSSYFGVVIILIVFILLILHKNQSSKYLQKKEKIILSNIKILILIVGFVAVNIGIKEVTKIYFKEPRPYIVWSYQQIPDKKANSLYVWENKNNQEINNYFTLLITKYATQNNIVIPSQYLKQLQSASKYSFPSGHTIFIATLALLFFFFERYIPNNKKLSFSIFTGLITIYTILVETSRIILGMHYPHDVLASVLISWIVIRIGFYIIENINFLAKLFELHMFDNNH